MSTTTFRIGLAILGCLVLGVLGVMVGRSLLADHDGWSIIRPVEVDADPLIIEPGDLLTKKDQDSIRKVVEEARFYGIPWSVKVVSDETMSASVASESLARTSLEEANIESRPDADDGLLMYVLIPAEDHTATSVAFATGDNFYPMGGITPEWLQWIADVQMAPLIEKNAIGDAVIEGSTWVEWTQLFRPAPDPPATNLEDGLRALLHPLATLALTVLTLVVGGSAVAVELLTRRRRTPPSAAAHPSLGPVLAASLANGRVDHRSLAGVVLDALDRGVLMQRDGQLSATQASPSPDQSVRDEVVLQEVARMEASGVAVTPARLARALRSTPLRASLEDALADAGYLDSRSYRYQLALRIAALAGMIVGGGALVLCVVGEVAPTLAAAIALTAISMVVLIWNETRSWTTSAGQAATGLWLAQHQHPDDQEHALFNTVCHLDDVSIANRSAVAASLRFEG